MKALVHLILLMMKTFYFLINKTLLCNIIKPYQSNMRVELMAIEEGVLLCNSVISLQQDNLNLNERVSHTDVMKTIMSKSCNKL